MLRSALAKTRTMHLRLDRETHLAFKQQLLKLDVTMQDAFHAFAEEVGAGQASALNIVERMLRRQVNEELASVGLKPRPAAKSKPERVSDIDHETLYDLINEGDPGVADDDDDDNDSTGTTEDKGRNEAA